MSHNNTDKAMQIQQQANEWLVRQQGGFSATEQRQLEAWLDEDSAHQQAFQQAEHIWQLSALLADDPELSQPVAAQTNSVPVHSTQTNTASQSNLFSSLLAPRLMMTALLLLGLWNVVPLPDMFLAWQADHYSADGQPRNITLSDGSRVHLSGKSAINIEYDSQVRRLQLLAGEAIFYPVAISSAEQRPFQVMSGQHQVEALGTIFYVRHAEQTEVAVLEHSVRVSEPESDQFNDAVVTQGEAGVVAESGFDFAPEHFDLQQAISWHQGRLVFKQKSADEIIKRLNQFYAGRIILLGNTDQQKQLTAVFQLNNLDQAVATLAKELGLQQKDLADFKILY